MPTYLDAPGLFPLRHEQPPASTSLLRVANVLDSRAMWRQQHQGDLLLLSVVLVFLIGSYLICRYCRCRWLYKRRSRSPAQRDGVHTTYRSYGNGLRSGGLVLEPVTEKTRKVKSPGVLVSDMEQPFLGPPDYEQPPPYELSPPAYEYLPSAPPLSDDAEHSPRQV